PTGSIDSRTPSVKSVLSTASCRRISDRRAIPCRRTASQTSWSPCAPKGSRRRTSTRWRRSTRRVSCACSEMFTLDAVVPWGRSFDEYRAMFALSDRDLGLTILDCGGGPASFNAEGTRRGSSIVSCDPLYQFDVPQIAGRVNATYEQILEQTRR